MAWTQPRTWSAELVTAAMFNEQLRDNLLALKNPPSDVINADLSFDYTTTSTTFVNVTNAADGGTDVVSLTIVTNGGDVMVGFVGSFDSTGGSVYLTLRIDDTTTAAGDDGIVRMELGTATTSIGFVYLITGLAAGSHKFNLRWKASAGTITLYAGEGTLNNDLHPQFWAREVS